MSAPQTAGTVFSRWLSAEVTPFLRESGWTREGHVFVRAAGANAGLIAFRKWKWYNAAVCRFWVEAGVFSPRLAAVEAALLGVPIPERPTLLTGAVLSRLSSLMGEHEDVAWTIRQNSLAFELEALGVSVRDELERLVLPFVADHLTDEAIRDEMLARLDGLGRLGLVRLRGLVEDLGPADRLADIDTEFAREDARRAAERADYERAWEASEAADVAAADAAMRSAARD